MIVNIFYALFTLLLLLQPFSHSYIPSHGTIEFFASQQHKNNMHWGVSPTHIQLPYERHNRCTQKKSSKKNQTRARKENKKINVSSNPPTLKLRRTGSMLNCNNISNYVSR